MEGHVPESRVELYASLTTNRCIVNFKTVCKLLLDAVGYAANGPMRELLGIDVEIKIKIILKHERTRFPIRPSTALQTASEGKC